MPLKPEAAAFPNESAIKPLRDENGNISGILQIEAYRIQGLTARQYAAIHLRVPDSGEDWMDKMIRTSRLADATEVFIASGKENQVASVYMAGLQAQIEGNPDAENPAETPCKK